MKNPKILLIYPPKTITENFRKLTRLTIIPPLGLAYLAAVLRNNEFNNIKIIDCIIEDPHVLEGHDLKNGFIRFGLLDQEIKEIIKNYDPDIVGVSMQFSMHHKDATNICKLAKEVNPNCKTIVGGAHPTNCINTVMDEKVIDYILLGEAEYSFLEFIKSVTNEDDSYKKIDGFVYRENEEIKINPKTKFIENLDEIPLPARDLLPIKKYIEVDTPQGDSTTKFNTTIFTSRGCPFGCTFCSTHTVVGRKFRARSAKNVLDEIEFLIKGYGIKEIQIEDDNMTFNKKRAMEIFNGMIERNFNIKIVFPMGTAIHTLDEELIMTMKKAGVFSLSVAVESGNQDILYNVIKKPLNLEKAKLVAKWLRKHNIKSKGFFILGMPGETKENMYETIEFAKQLKLDWCGFAIATPLPGSELYQTCRDNGYIKEIDWTNLYLNEAKITTPEFTPEEVDKIYYKANIEVNFKENPNLKPEGNINQAIIDFERVVKLVPKHAWAHACLSKAYLIKSKADQEFLEKARKELNIVISLNPDEEDLIELINNIKKELEK